MELFHDDDKGWKDIDNTTLLSTKIIHARYSKYRGMTIARKMIYPLELNIIGFGELNTYALLQSFRDEYDGYFLPCYGFKQAISNEEHVWYIYLPYETTNLEQFIKSIPDENERFRHLPGLTKHITIAIQTLHKFGLIHGDIKPTNIMYCQEETYPFRLIDFDLTSPKSFIGSYTEEYRPPEVQFFLPTFQSDIFAFGITLCEYVLGNNHYDRQYAYPHIITQRSLRHKIDELNKPNKKMRDLIEYLGYIQIMIDPKVQARKLPDFPHMNGYHFKVHSTKPFYDDTGTEYCEIHMKDIVSRYLTCGGRDVKYPIEDVITAAYNLIKEYMLYDMHNLNISSTIQECERDIIYRLKGLIYKP